MDATNKFLDELSSNPEMIDFWSQYHQFCKEIESANIEKLVKGLPNIIKKIQNNLSSAKLYNGISKACQQDLKFGKELYNKIFESSCEKTNSVLGTIVSGISKKDPIWASNTILNLLNDSNDVKVVQAISSIASFDLSDPKLENFISVIDNKFSEFVNNGETNNILANIIFSSRNQRKHIPNADKNISKLLNRESDEIKAQLVDFLNFNIDIETEEEFYKEVLNSLISLDLRLKNIYNSLAYLLQQKVKNHSKTITEFINNWIAYNKDNAKNLKLLQPILNEIYDTKLIGFQILITDWLNEDNPNYHIATFSLMREMSYRGVSSMNLNANLIHDYKYEDIEYLSKKIIGFVYERELQTSLLYSIIDARYTDEKVIVLIGNIFINHLIFNYYSTIDFLKEKKKKANNKLKIILDQIINEGERYYDAYSKLKILKEFQPSEIRLKYIDRVQSKKFRKSYDEKEENNNSFLSMVTTLHFRSGKSSFGKFNGEYSAHMEPKLISHSSEMPRGEFIDPIGQSQLRLEGQNFKRRR